MYNTIPCILSSFSIEVQSNSSISIFFFSILNWLFDVRWVDSGIKNEGPIRVS